MRRDTGRLEDRETEDGQEDVQRQGQTCQNQTDGAGGPTANASPQHAGPVRKKEPPGGN